MTTIRFENIAKTFGRTTVIKDLDLTIQDGEFFTFVGPSGCGKSTILNMIAGLEDPSAGSVLFDGRAVNRLSPPERDVAMVFQSYALYPHLTVYENIAFPLRMKKERKDKVDEEVTRAAGLLGISDFLGKKPRELSGGQRQRVALGRAIVRKPKVFLMDEPLSNLDARLRVETRAELKRLHHELGITTVYVTHDQSEAMGLSDRIAVIDRGMVRQCDAPQEVYRRPADTFVAGFVGSPAMNILSCDVRQESPLVAGFRGTALSLPGSVPAGTRTVLVGIRPEDLHVESSEIEGSIQATVSVVEAAGPVLWVDLDWGGFKVTGVAAPDAELRPGSSAYLTVVQGRVSLFDEKSGERL